MLVQVYYSEPLVAIASTLAGNIKYYAVLRESFEYLNISLQFPSCKVIIGGEECSLLLSLLRENQKIHLV